MSRAAKRPDYRNQDKAHKRKPCIDCVKEGITTQRKTTDSKGNPYPGPRCATHHRLKRAQRKSVTQEQRWLQVYGITAEEYWLIYEEQDGRCAICRRATGASKMLSVDHDHKSGVVRGLLCLGCNRNVLGHARDEIEFFERAIEYLNAPPAVRAIGVRTVPEEG
ncbi:hypothetical protein FHT44_004953 [Mycolicibacterium sp. BK634]|uniref:endonuclease VII domain-containing protein n=1 Tax=Mycolicibacterium sp. BK634 TaxID=2587099 RepID=UPI001615B0DC|nr:endonuclease VII domain-containing protein [Mycolicibacterium sp. BK634]MBB3752441.1 hypothetical protein [Mycolicibacterium sp. BK634]